MRLGAFLLLMIATSMSVAQIPQIPQPSVDPTLPPLLYLRLSAPKGAYVTIYRGATQGQRFDLPCMIALRPGYCCRLALGGMDAYPQQIFYPTIEARGSLLLPGSKGAQFPAGIHFSPEDFTQIAAGSMVQKFVLLEHPDAAVPQASKADQPIEIQLPVNQDPRTEIQQRGLPMAVVTIGQRMFEPYELAQVNQVGAILLPGERHLPTPRVPPHAPWGCYPLVDPLLGPIRLEEYWKLCDGGDSGLLAGYNRAGQLKGFDPSDTIAEYDDSKGARHITVSNRVCLCVPRYIVLRNETLLAANSSKLTTSQAHLTKHGVVLDGKQPIYTQQINQQLELAQRELKLSIAETLQNVIVTGKLEGIDIKGSVLAPDHVTGHKGCPPKTTEKLIIIKWPDKCAAAVGEVVTFYLRVFNKGDVPIANVVVSDSLISRFEYVPGTARSDREVTFTTQANDVGSQVLRWELPGALQAGDAATVTFQVRIR